MNKYESVCILAQNCSNEYLLNMISKIQNKIQRFSKTPVSFENIGKRKLAYSVKNNTEGYFVVFNFEAKNSDISKLEKFYRLTDEVLKYITVRSDD